MRLQKIRELFLQYFVDNSHEIIPSSPLIPKDDPTLMFVNSGMVQFKSYFTGKTKPSILKAVTVQKCIRAGGKHNDLEQVGITARHHTFFEMCGNFSFGDYFKKQAIFMAWEFLTKILELPKDKLYITVYHEDQEAFNIWQELTGFDEGKIIRINTNDNFWSMGNVGPCGPCSEIFYDHGEAVAGGPPGSELADGDRFVEIWNLVFMQFEQLEDGSRIALPKPSIDTGMGLERIAAVMQGVHDNYDIDLFRNIINGIKGYTGQGETVVSHRVIADHLRAACFLIADGVMPSNEGHGYVLRRIIRRAIRHIHKLEAKEALLYKLVPILIIEMGQAYPELARAESLVTSVLRSEEEGFRETLTRGLKILDEATVNMVSGDILGGDMVFKLYDTYGFPVDMTRDILKSRNIDLDEVGFERMMLEQRERARAAWTGSGETGIENLWFEIDSRVGATDFLGYCTNAANAKVEAIIADDKLVDKAESGVEPVIVVLNQTPFYGESGGQMGDIGNLDEHIVIDTKKVLGRIHAHYVKLKGAIAVGDIVHAAIDIAHRDELRANHSATHLLHYALRKKFGEHVVQKGSLVTVEKLRFDFSHTEALTRAQILALEAEVNQMIRRNHSAETRVMASEIAVKEGAMALFGEKYENEVRVVSIGQTMELCGGTHVAKTGDIGLFKIMSEQAIAAGVRRIEALTGQYAMDAINKKEEALFSITQLLKSGEDEAISKVVSLIEAKKVLEKRVEELTLKAASQQVPVVEEIAGVKFIYTLYQGLPAKYLQQMGAKYRGEFSEKAVVLLVTNEHNKLSLVVMVSEEIKSKYPANEILQAVVDQFGGNGGGKADFAQAGGGDPTKFESIINFVKNYIKPK